MDPKNILSVPQESWRRLDAHRASCGKVVVPCTNCERGCEESMERLALADHLREDCYFTNGSATEEVTELLGYHNGDPECHVKFVSHMLLVPADCGGVPSTPPTLRRELTDRGIFFLTPQLPALAGVITGLFPSFLDCSPPPDLEQNLVLSYLHLFLERVADPWNLVHWHMGYESLEIILDADAGLGEWIPLCVQLAEGRRNSLLSYIQEDPVWPVELPKAKDIPLIPPQFRVPPAEFRERFS